MRSCISLLTFLLCLVPIVVEGDEDKLFDERNERYSSSTVGLLKLLKVEQQFADILIKYAGQLGEKSQLLLLFFSEVGFHLKRSSKEKEEYVSNPLNAFSLLRRTSEDLPKWYAYFEDVIKKDDLSVLDDLVKKVPNKVDLDSAIQGIQRIERIYDLQIDDMAEGLLHDKQYNARLSYRDLIAMGNMMYHQREYQTAAKWYRIACQRELEDLDRSLNEVLGNPSEYLHRQHIKALFISASTRLDPSKPAEEAFTTAEKAVAETSKEDVDNFMFNLNDPENDLIIKKQLYQTKRSPSNFEIGCRGLYRRKRNLVCRYNFTTTPFLRLAPLKFEEINLDPYIGMYHEVLYDSEIEELKGQSTNMVNGYADQRNGTEIRQTVARHAWWSDTSPVRERINQRIIDMTGFNFSKTEEIQIANYGVGTYFKPHFDYTADGFETPDVTALGDRIASIIFYASDVPQGGATVFPDVKVSILPRKGSSLYWFNLFDDGRPDERSKHSVCPVINGDRWTLTKWVHLFPQMFTMPCST
ncbi:prolyl 4-hydroxylase subunit alpha-1 [Drosophila biarmipes]|uniref:prolyl 4-hydroxylase subunit alpha-1 n=1 Tax=Drosophila biarmipes TaxID=125945 RepID=UPI0007E82237|nr:prolyl 4-hydroxylase subunit alpha-1 [Drosophila biarmipes]